MGRDHLHSRLYSHNLRGSVLGFKIKFRGRFTRKQRSGSVWYHRGRTALSRIMSHVEFGYYAAPLLNSTISIKVWVNRAPFYGQSYNYLVI